MNETLEQKLAALRLGRIRQVYPSWLEQAAHSELGYDEFLEQLVTEELLARQEN
jgi:DNA replication protein DnaC